MERLTSYKGECRREMICRYEDCDTCKEYCPYMNEDNCPCLQEVLEKLAEYEDIGLTPQQLKEVDRLYAEKCKELAESEKRSFSGIEMVKIWANLKSFKEYQKLEKQGKLLKLPCAVGDSIYIILGTKKIEERKVIAFKMIAKGWAAEVSDWLYLFEEFGKTIFLTKDEAEAALKKL